MMRLPALNEVSKQAGNSWLVFGVILLVNIFQSYFSALLNDEPYYWVYSQYLNWGYFDHPPLIAFLIKAGSSMLGGEIGVRLLTLLVGSFTFFIIYKIIEEESDSDVNFKLAVLLLTSSIFLNLYSFLAIPDTPMLFFTASFLYAYRRYLKADNFFNAVLLGVLTALLLYSKYHGILVIFFTLISNLALFTKRTFYVIAAVALVLYLPHINWQIANDYQTLRFQFTGRASAFKIEHVLSYVGEQAAVTGPVILLLFSILFKPKDQFQRSLKYNVIGVFLFFLASSFKDMVNVHWTAIAWPGMIILAYFYITEIKTYGRQIYALLVLNLVLVVVLRVNLAVNIFSIPNFNDKNPKVMASVLQKETKSYPLVFADTYNEPAYYSFYTHKHAFALNSIRYKKTQYNFLPALEQKFQGKTVNYITEWPFNDLSRKITIPHGKTYYLTNVTDFTSFSGVIVNVLNKPSFKAGLRTRVRLTINGDDLTSIESRYLKTSKAFIMLTFIHDQTQESFYYKCPLPDNLSDWAPFDFVFNAPQLKGRYRYMLSVVPENHVILGFNSDVYSCNIH